MQRFAPNLGNPPNTPWPSHLQEVKRKIDINFAGVKSRRAPIALAVTAAAFAITITLVLVPVHAQTTTSTTTSTGTSVTNVGMQHHCTDMGGGQNEGNSTASTGRTTSGSG